MIFSLSIHAFSRYFLVKYYLLGIVLGSGDKYVIICNIFPKKANTLVGEIIGERITRSVPHALACHLWNAFILNHLLNTFEYLIYIWHPTYPALLVNLLGIPESFSNY